MNFNRHIKTPKKEVPVNLHVHWDLLFCRQEALVFPLFLLFDLHKDMYIYILFQLIQHTVYDDTTQSYYNSSSSNWIVMSCQPHRVTSGQSNSGHKQIHISKFFSHRYINPLSSQSTTPNDQSLCKHKTYIIHKHQTQISEELVPSILSLLKEHIRLGHASIVDHSV